MKESLPSNQVAPSSGSSFPPVSADQSKDIAVTSSSNTTESSCLLNSSIQLPPPRKVVLDRMFLSRMRAHQVRAAEFLIEKLMAYASADSLSSSSSDATDSTKSSSSWQPQLDPALLTGAILADDMGTGKTLVALAVIWSICRQRACKCIVVCPTTLVHNWSREVKKWFDVGRSGAFLFASGGAGSGPKCSADAIVHSFIHAHATVHSTLVISYDMFRSFAAALNLIPNLELLVCDEGHRIKNSEGTKTSLALSNSAAFRRLVITGTPIQNNLDELFTIVDFIIPGYLGTLKEFQERLVGPITAGQSSYKESLKNASTHAMENLRRLLVPILLRRTKEEILHDSLPPRREYLIRCDMTQPQWKEYGDEVRAVLSSVQSACDVASAVPDSKTRRTRTLTGSTEDVESADVASNRNNENSVSYSFSSVLPTLIKLRQICNSSLTMSMDQNSVSGSAASNSVFVSQLLERSSKLQVM